MSAPSATYTLEDLKQRKTREKLWITIHQNVYDVTDFLDQVGWAVLGSSGIRRVAARSRGRGQRGPKGTGKGRKLWEFCGMPACREDIG